MDITQYRPKIFPFSALVGQERVKYALLLTAINPRLTGLLIQGEKGTAKSTAVRALADLLPEIEVVKDCVFNCHPRLPNKMCDNCLERFNDTGSLPIIKRKVKIVELPVSATEDRIVGSLDFEYSLKSGSRRLEPGVLAHANRGILYVDEINLLPDALADLLLDAAALGINIIEREGISFKHPAEFILIGSMNPEEGELRPQLLDRFGLCTTVESLSDTYQRLLVIRRQLEFEQDPSAFTEKWYPEQIRLQNKIREAQTLLPQVEISPELLQTISEICVANNTAGHRADILMCFTARTIAAFEGRNQVILEDLARAAEYVLLHRGRIPITIQSSLPLPVPSISQEEDKGSDTQVPTQWGEPDETDNHSNDQEPPDTPDSIFPIGDSFQIRSIEIHRDRLYRRRSGKRSPSKILVKSGRYVRSTAVRRNDDLALDATIRTAAPYQPRRKKKDLAITIESSDIREKVRERKVGNLLLFVVDASGSMGNVLMTETKGAIFSLLLDAYKRRDKVGLVAFRETSAEILLPPTNSIELATKLLEELPTGGKTPLVHGLITGYQLIKNHLRKESQSLPIMILISDCRPNVPWQETPYYDYRYNEVGYPKVIEEILSMAQYIQAEGNIRSLVIEVDDRHDHMSKGKDIAEALGAQYFRIQDLKAKGIVRLLQRR
jgi:magnesium chelatase subunit D